MGSTNRSALRKNSLTTKSVERAKKIDSSQWDISHWLPKAQNDSDDNFGNDSIGLQIYGQDSVGSRSP